MADQQCTLARVLLKELTTQLKVEEKSYEAFSLSASEVLCEPLFWPIIFEGQHIVQQVIESSWGVQGPLLLSFAAALRQQYGPPNEWIEAKILAILRYVSMLARAYLAAGDVNAAPEEFYRRNKILFETATDRIDHLDWNRVRALYGRKEAS